MMRKCKKIGCDNPVIEKFKREMENPRRKIYCSRKCCHSDWLSKNHDRRLAHSKKYDRKIGKIPREEWAKTAWKKEFNPNWRGGTTENYRLQRYKWKKMVFEVRRRDDSKCQHCGRMKGLDTHHIKPHKDGGKDILDNLITLCNSCHAKEEWNLRKGYSCLGLQ